MKFEKGSCTTLLYHCDPLGVLGIGHLVELDIAKYDILRKVELTSLNLTGLFSSSSGRIGLLLLIDFTELPVLQVPLVASMPPAHLL